jgi:hypothetical protein
MNGISGQRYGRLLQVIHIGRYFYFSHQHPEDDYFRRRR